MTHFLKKGILKGAAYLIAIVTITGVAQSLFAQTTYFSRQTGNWNTLSTWSLTSHTVTNAPGVLPQAGDIILIGGNDVVTIPAGFTTAAVASVTVYNTSGNGTLRVGGTAAGAVTLNTGTVTVSTGGTLTVGNTFNATNTITATGNITISGGAFTVGSGNTATNIVSAVNTNISAGTLRIGGTNTGTNTFTSSGNIALSGTGALQLGNTGNATNNLNVTGNISINGTSSLVSFGDAGSTNSLNFGGDITNNNVFNLSSAAGVTSTTTFNGTTAKTVSGTGATFTFDAFAMGSGVASNLNVNSSIRINGQLSFPADGLMVVNTTSILTLGNTATVLATGLGNSRYIQFDGIEASASTLIKINNNSTATWQILYPIGTAAGGYTPLDLRTPTTTITTAPTLSSTLSVKSIYNSSAIGQMRRTFRLTVAGNAAGTVFNSGVFSYNTTADVSSGDVATNYSTIWYLNLAAGSWVTLAGTSAGGGTFTPTAAGQTLANGTYYYTIGISTAYPSIWYTYQNGNWSTANVWTLDPSGTSLNNPLNEVPSLGDQVVILNGFTVTNDANSRSIASVKIEAGAILDMAATTGNNLGIVTGTGLLRVNGVGLPTGTYTSFVAASTGGTIEYYNTGGTFTTTSQTTYNNLIFSNSTGSAITFITACNLTVNNNFDITATGAGTVTWQINDNSNNQRTMSITGNLTVSANGQIRAGAGNEGTNATGVMGPTFPHTLTLSGNFTNNGSAKFFDTTDNELLDTEYTNGNVYGNELQGNAVNVIFSGTNDKTVTCNNITDFYRLTINKGTSQQPILTVNSSAATNMRLFGPANMNSSGTSPNETSDCALSIVAGTLQLTGTLTIPVLSTNGPGAAGADYFSLPQSAALWINGASVNVTIANSLATNDDQRLLFSGLLRVSNGTLNGGFSRGIGSASGGTFLMEGGTVNIWQYRPLFGGTNIFTYIQSGGTVNIGTTGYNGTVATSGVVDFVTEDYARFSLPTTTSSFQMSGGVLNIGTPSQNTTTAGAQGIDIQSSSNNYNVTGGTINAYIPSPAGSFNFGINSTAPFYNLNIYREGTAAAFTATINQALTILNNLTIVTGNTPTFNCNGNNLTVGGNIDVQASTVLLTGTNTITLNGLGNQTWTNNGTINQTTAAANPALMNNLVVNKTGTLTLEGTGGFPGSSTIINGSMAGLTLISGTLNDGGKTLTVSTTLTNNATHTSTGSGAVVYTNAAASTISGSNGTFGNLTLSNAAVAALLIATDGTQTITGNLRITNAFTSLNIGSNSLTVLGGLFTDNGTAVAFSNTCRIRTNGLRNDGGLTRQATSGTDLLFPVGTSTILYTPSTINVAATTVGTITVRPVRSEHPNVTGTPNTATVQYYWRVTSAGFSGITAVTHKNYTFSTATKNGTLTTYVPARYNPNTFTWNFRTTTYNATGTTIITQPAPANGFFNTGTGWSGLSSDQLDGEYTAGNSSAFGTLTVYYSRVNNSNWNTASNWSNDAARVSTSGSVPCSTCPVIIGDGSSFNHTININANSITCGSLQIASGSTLDCGSFTGLNFGTNTDEVVSGTGTLRINVAVLATGNFPAGDFTTFIGLDGGTVEWYGSDATARTLPTTGPAPQTLNLSTYYNLVINPFTGQTITMPATNVTIYNILTKIGAGTVATNTGAARSITINGDFSISQGTFAPQNAFAASFSVAGNTTVASGASFSVPGGGTQTHTFTTAGNLTNNGTVNFNNASIVTLTFTGTSNTSLTGTNGAAATTLNSLIVNKGTSQTPVLTVDVAGTVTTPSNAWLTLQNGTINFNKTGGTFILSNTGTAYSIPSTAKLAVQAGTVTIGNTGSDAADLSLSGTLEVTGGTVNIGVSTNDNNNDIEYAAAGTPTINVSGGTLYVNGAIRRPTTTLSGALVYNQTGGTVNVGGRNCDAVNTRGVFEIENNTGSSFTLTGGTSILEIRRSTGGTSFADLYLNPANSSVGATSTIQMGSISLGAQSLSVNVDPAIGGFRVLGATGNAQTVTMQTSQLIAAGALTIDQASTLNTNSLNVSIGGDMSVNATGVYNGSNNTTTFNGTVDQNAALSSAAGNLFLHITVNKTAGTEVIISGASPTVTNLNILSGELNIPAITLTVNGDIVNNSLATGAGYISMNGAATTHAITSSGGTFTNLRLDTGPATKVVTVDGDMTILGDLNFATTSRFLSIGGNQLTFGTGGSASGTGSSAFVRTNGASSDLGVVKNWATTGTDVTFNYPVGTMNSYTPVQLTLNVSVAGNITVTPVNSRHPSYDFSSTEQILNYYWIIQRDNSIAYSATGSHVYSYSSGLMGGSGGALVAGYLNMTNPTGWVTTGHGGIANATTMTFTDLLNTNLPATTVTFHYTCGTANTLLNPIGTIYSRLAGTVTDLNTGGNWSDPNSWTLSASGVGAALSVAPIGSPIVILSGARINIDIDSRAALSTQINGVLNVGNTVGHDLGVISGTGTLRSNTNTFPAGTYTAFVASTGGTIEYVAPMTMNNRSTYNNVSIIGTGSVTMTSTNIVINGNLTIGSTAVLNNSTNNSNITLARDWTNNGTFTSGTGTVTFNGSTAQVVTGSTTFNNFTMTKSAGTTLTLSGSATTTVNGTLTLTTGHIVSSSSHMISLSSSASVSGGSVNSFISGPVQKTISSAGSFTFPVGSITGPRYRDVGLANTTAADTWTVEFVPRNPTLDGYSNSTLSSSLQQVSDFDYWNISRGGATAADITISYSTGSYYGSDVGNMPDLRVAHWDGAQWDLPPGSGIHSAAGTSTTGTITCTNVTSFSPIAAGSVSNTTTTLPVTWISFTANRVDNISVKLDWQTAQEQNNDHFDIERSSDGKIFFKIGSALGSGTTKEMRSYKFVDREASASQRHYYRIRQVDYDGNAMCSSMVVVSETDEDLGKRWMVYPNPVGEGKSIVLEQINPSVNADQVINVIVLSSTGQVVFEGQGSLSEVSSKLEHLSEKIRSGAYIMKISNGNYFETFKIVRN